MTPITTTAELAAYCDKIKGQPFVAVDTEFMRETTYWPKLCLIQAAAPNAECVIDPLAEGLDLEPFLEILRDESIEKVFHAARQDVEIFNNLKAMPKPLFDTQVAGMAAGYGEQIAYDALVRQMLKIELDKSSRFTDWARRPLSEAQLTYALADVTHLAALYPMLKARLEKEGRLGWVHDEMQNLCDPAVYDVEPENAWKRLKPRRHTSKYLAVYKAVAAWRERTAQQRDQPRGRILKDEAIDELATQAPTDAAAVDRLRSVPKGFSGSRFGPDLLDAIKEALKDPDAYAPVIERSKIAASPAAGAVVELLKVLLKARAEDSGVASKLIATVSDLEQIANDDNAKTPALVGWRREAFGEDALKLKRGELALVLDGTRVRVVEVRRAPKANAAE
ncbi:MAG: ribonuclease D [Phenylobacterium sp.]|uniref:Ribonuclease D n=1 Tax=Phenylobacterium ferrooxidans TaxID=2982689 RepID=A0ABW6CRU8_9CAUL|nr:ribonuclease D [Phenylobacterium sp.]MDO8324338.1 ribonuclease D [Phenylobacterium sp.]MDO8914234.1 ribonuclease D [Phenylobacterium sp.]MDO9248760.1 ribonuclease D [Phenylobacterium sp.]MDP2009045.1 ribonuclease D [Phenylobacterium sp.]MDP3101172.1 ribonuclease D [Phenylobacterium sp.]